jgi:hypothetical protein
MGVKINACERKYQEGGRWNMEEELELDRCLVYIPFSISQACSTGRAPFM